VTKPIEFPPGAFRRMNEEDDHLFYAQPRRVVHIDDDAIAALRALYATLVPEAATGMLVPDTHPRAGGFTSLGTPVRFGRTPGTIRTPAPQLGEHTELVLCEAGIAADEIARLRTAKVVA